MPSTTHGSFEATSERAYDKAQSRDHGLHGGTDLGPFMYGLSVCGMEMMKSHHSGIRSAVNCQSTAFSVGRTNQQLVRTLSGSWVEAVESHDGKT